MNKRSIATLCALGIAGSLLVSPSALAKDVQLDTRNNRDICTVTLDSAEQEIAKKFFTLKIEEQTKAQNRMRKEFPQYSSLFEAWDNHPEVQENSITSPLTPSTSELEAKGFEDLDRQYLFFTNSDKEAKLKEWASTGYPYDLEVARNWPNEEMGDYPFTEKPVIFAQDGNSVTPGTDTFYQLPSVYNGLQFGLPPSPRLKAMLSPGELRLKTLEDQFEAVAGFGSLISLLGNTQTPALLCENAYLQKESEEEAARQAAEAKRKAEEAAKKAEEEKRKAEEAAKKAEEEKRKAEEAKKPKPSTPKGNAKPAEEGSSTAGIVGIVLGVLALVGGAAFALLPQLREALNLKF